MSSPQKTYPPLSDQQIKRALYLKAGNLGVSMNWEKVAKNMGLPYYQILTHFDPKMLVRERKRAHQRNGYWSQRYIKGKNIYAAGHNPGGRAEPPPEAIEERNRAYEPSDSLTVMLCGDPRPGRSALDRRK